MKYAEIWLIVIILLGFLNIFLISRLSAYKKLNYFKQMLCLAPVTIFLLLIYALILFKNFIGLVFGLGVVFFVYFYIIINKIVIDNLSVKISAFGELRKKVFLWKINRNQTRNIKPIEMQEKGFLPNNETLLKYGFTEEELKKLGLLD
jgi:hypothetical protein